MSEQSSALITPHNKRKHEHPSFSVMIREAILKEGGPQGCTRQAIFKFIMNNFDVAGDATEVRKCLRMAIVRGLKRGMLVNSRGSGARGSFILADDVKKLNAAPGDAYLATKKKRDKKDANQLVAEDVVSDMENRQVSCQDDVSKSIRTLKSYYEKCLEQKDAIIKVFQAMVDQTRREKHMVLTRLQAQDQALANVCAEIKMLQADVNLLHKNMIEKPEKVYSKDPAGTMEDSNPIWLQSSTVEPNTSGIWSPAQVVSLDPYLPVWQWVGREVEQEP